MRYHVTYFLPECRICCVGNGEFATAHKQNRHQTSSEYCSPVNPSLLLIRFRMLLSWWNFYTSADLLLFVPLSRHLPPSSPPHPSPNNISLAFRCFFGHSLFLLVLISPVFGVFYIFEITNFIKNKVQECSRCDSKFTSYGLVCSVFIR